MRKRFKRSRVPMTLRKIERATRTEIDRAFHTELAGIARQRDEKLALAGSEYRAALTAAKDAHTAARAEAWKVYDESRIVILKTLAPQDEQVAA